MYSVEILPRAVEDMNEAVIYVARKLENPRAARQLAETLHQAVEGLSEYPYSHAAYIPPRPLKHEYRRVMAGNYAVFYWIEEKERRVTVARVIYSRRDMTRHLA